jgi:hypothetical protein
LLTHIGGRIGIVVAAGKKVLYEAHVRAP